MTVTRGEFLRSLGASAACAAAGCCGVPAGAPAPRYGLQLYSIHKIFWKSPEKILAALKAGGYDGVEFYNDGGRTAKELRRMCADAGLTPIGTHLNGDVDLVGDRLEKTLNFAQEAGFESLVTPHASRDSADGYKAFGRAMGAAAEAAASRGIKVGIHSTYHHFKTKYGGVTAWDVIYSEASPLLQLQIDTGNTFHTGEALVPLFEKYRGRHYSVHAKENVPTVDGVFGVPPKDGGPCVPWRDVIACLKKDPSQKWWIVEAEGKPASLDPALACVARLRTWCAR